MTPPGRRPGAAPIDAGALAALCVAAGVAVMTALEPDLWGHLRFGLDLLLTKRLTALDPYSFTQDVPWVNHEWLSELAVAVAYRAGGVVGLLLFKAGVLAASFLAVARWAAPIDRRFRGWILAVGFLGLVPMAITLRPQLWTILGLALLCGILRGTWRLSWMPLLFALWANLHGGWIVGLAVAGLFAAGSVFDREPFSRVRALTIATAASAAATLANPYGWRLWQFLFETVRMSRPDITEWRPYWERFEPQHLTLWPLTMAVLVIALVGRRRHWTWRAALPALWIAVSGLFVARLAPMASLLMIFVAVDAWRTSADASAAAGAMPRRWIIDGLAAAAIAVPLLWTEARCLPIDPSWGPDVQAAASLDDTAIAGRLVVPFDWGEYAIWHWGGRLKVSIDGRRETIYSEAVIRLQQAVALGEPDGLEYLERVRPEYVWVKGSTSSALGEWLPSNSYRIDVQTPRSFIAVRSDLPQLAAAPPLSACFP